MKNEYIPILLGEEALKNIKTNQREKKKKKANNI